MNKHSVLIPILSGAFALACFQAASADQPDARDAAWLDDYLAAELGYNQEQIDEFKANVAPLPPRQMRELVERMKFAVGRSDQREQARLSAHRRNLQRIYTAESMARARPARVAPRYVNGMFSEPLPRPRVQPVHRTGLFRGYYGWIGIP